MGARSTKRNRRRNAKRSITRMRRLSKNKKRSSMRRNMVRFYGVSQRQKDAEIQQIEKDLANKDRLVRRFVRNETKLTVEEQKEYRLLKDSIDADTRRLENIRATPSDEDLVSRSKSAGRSRSVVRSRGRRGAADAEEEDPVVASPVVFAQSPLQSRSRSVGASRSPIPIIGKSPSGGASNASKSGKFYESLMGASLNQLQYNKQNLEVIEVAGSGDGPDVVFRYKDKDAKVKIASVEVKAPDATECGQCALTCELDATGKWCLAYPPFDKNGPSVRLAKGKPNEQAQYFIDAGLTPDKLLTFWEGRVPNFLISKATNDKNPYQDAWLPADKDVELKAKYDHPPAGSLKENWKWVKSEADDFKAPKDFTEVTNPDIISIYYGSKCDYFQFMDYGTFCTKKANPIEQDPLRLGVEPLHMEYCVRMRVKKNGSAYAWNNPEGKVSTPASLTCTLSFKILKKFPTKYDLTNAVMLPPLLNIDPKVSVSQFNQLTLDPTSAFSMTEFQVIKDVAAAAKKKRDSKLGLKKPHEQLEWDQEEVEEPKEITDMENKVRALIIPMDSNEEKIERLESIEADAITEIEDAKDAWVLQDPVLMKECLDRTKGYIEEFSLVKRA